MCVHCSICALEHHYHIPNKQIDRYLIVCANANQYLPFRMINSRRFPKKNDPIMTLLTGMLCAPLSLTLFGLSKYHIMYFFSLMLATISIKTEH